MLKQLFRDEAVTHAYRRLEGSVLISTAHSTKVLTVAVMVILLVGFGFLATASYARKETVPGWIVPDGGLVRLAARQGGQIDTIALQEGDRVAPGQLVATVGLTPDVGAAGDAGQAMIENVTSQETAVRDEGTAELARLDQLETGLKAQRSSLDKSLIENQNRIAVFDDRVKLTETQLARYRPLAEKGIVTAPTLETYVTSKLSAEQSASQLRSDIETTRRQIADVDQQLGQIPHQREAARATVAEKSASLSQQRTNILSQSAINIASPINGRVMAIPAERGQMLPPGGTVAIIGPENAQLTAELYVPTRAAGFIQAGQSVRLMYQAFPYQKYGTGAGTVVSVSKTSLGPGETMIPGAKFDEPMFRVRVRLDKPTVSAYGKAVALQPGMLLTADVILERRNLFQWLFDPLFASGRRV